MGAPVVLPMYSTSWHFMMLCFAMALFLRRNLSLTRKQANTMIDFGSCFFLGGQYPSVPSVF